MQKALAQRAFAYQLHCHSPEKGNRIVIPASAGMTTEFTVVLPLPQLLRVYLLLHWQRLCRLLQGPVLGRLPLGLSLLSVNS